MVGGVVVVRVGSAEYKVVGELLDCDSGMQGPTVAMQPQVAEVYNFCTK